MTNRAVDVARPSLLTCCKAVAGVPLGAVRPRRPDTRFLASLTDHGVPTSGTTVEIIRLPQRERRVPTLAIAEGVWLPARTSNSINAFVVRHRRATFLVDPGVCVDVVDRAVADLPWSLRIAVKPRRDVIDIRQALALAGVDAADIDFAVPTHLHWDHVAGLLDSRGCPSGFIVPSTSGWWVTGSLHRGECGPRCLTGRSPCSSSTARPS